jgi:hypothetical protein
MDAGASASMKLDPSTITIGGPNTYMIKRPKQPKKTGRRKKGQNLGSRFVDDEAEEAGSEEEITFYPDNLEEDARESASAARRNKGVTLGNPAKQAVWGSGLSSERGFEASANVPIQSILGGEDPDEGSEDESDLGSFIVDDESEEEVQSEEDGGEVVELSDEESEEGVEEHEEEEEDEMEGENEVAMIGAAHTDPPPSNSTLYNSLPALMTIWTALHPKRKRAGANTLPAQGQFGAKEPRATLQNPEIDAAMPAYLNHAGSEPSELPMRCNIASPSDEYAVSHTFGTIPSMTVSELLRARPYISNGAEEEVGEGEAAAKKASKGKGITASLKLKSIPLTVMTDMFTRGYEGAIVGGFKPLHFLHGDAVQRMFYNHLSATYQQTFCTSPGHLEMNPPFYPFVFRLQADTIEEAAVTCIRYFYTRLRQEGSITHAQAKSLRKSDPYFAECYRWIELSVDTMNESFYSEEVADGAARNEAQKRKKEAAYKQIHANFHSLTGKYVVNDVKVPSPWICTALTNAVSDVPEFTGDEGQKRLFHFVESTHCAAEFAEFVIVSGVRAQGLAGYSRYKTDQTMRDERNRAAAQKVKMSYKIRNYLGGTSA